METIRKIIVSLCFIFMITGIIYTTAKEVPAAETTAAAAPVVTSRKSVVYGKTLSLKTRYAENYKSSDTSILKVSSKGKVTPVKAGKAIVTYTVSGKEKAVEVTVKKAATKIKLKKKTLTLKAGKKISIKASSKVSLSYKSKNKKVATVSSKGVITGVSAGTVKIKVSGASSEKYKAPKTRTVTVKVKKGDSNITVSTKSLTTFVGVSEKLGASSQVPVNYKVSGNCITVDSSGKLKAVSTGKALVTITGTGTESYNKPSPVSVYVTVKQSVIDTYIPKSNETYNMKVYYGPKTPALFLQTCSIVAKTIVNDGNWLYSDGNNQRSFSAARNIHRNVNCSGFVCFAMQQFGTLPQGLCFYSGKTSTKANMGYCKNSSVTKDAKGAIESSIAKYYNVIDTNGKTVTQLDSEGNLKAGDILCYSYHMNVYAGKNASGVRTWYDFGCDGTKLAMQGVSHPHEEKGYTNSPFVRVMKTGNRNTAKVVRIYRLKAQS